MPRDEHIPRTDDGSPPASLDESALVARIRAGDAVAFETLFTTYAPPLCDFVFRYVHVREDAQEIVQELFVRLWIQRATLMITGSIANYLYGAARHRAFDRLRHEKVMQRWREHARADGMHIDAGDAGADVALELAERETAIARAIAELPERRRAICVLRWVQGLSYAEIAQRLGIAEKTVDSQLQRAVQHVKQRLAEG